MKAGRKPNIERNKAVYKLAKKGLNYTDIGKMFKITRQRVCQIKADVDKLGSISLTSPTT